MWFEHVIISQDKMEILLVVQFSEFKQVIFIMDSDMIFAVAMCDIHICSACIHV